MPVLFTTDGTNYYSHGLYRRKLNGLTYSDAEIREERLYPPRAPSLIARVEHGTARCRLIGVEARPAVVVYVVVSLLRFLLTSAAATAAVGELQHGKGGG